MTKQAPSEGVNRAKPRFRIQEAILILRQGKSHPLWREAAWHLMEYAGKDTQLLLEAQRDLIEGAHAQEAPPSYKKWIVMGLGLVAVLVGLLIWKVVEHGSLMC